jgi:hypothetical protein
MKLEYSLEYNAKWYQDPYSERNSSTTSFSHISVFNICIEGLAIVSDFSITYPVLPDFKVSANYSFVVTYHQFV